LLIGDGRWRPFRQSTIFDLQSAIRS